MDARALNQFLTLARTLHFARAADALALSPSALSRAIRRLEDELGVRLFDRTNREVRLTAEGQVLLMQAEELMERLQALEYRLRAGHEQLEGSLSLYCSVTAAYSLLSGLLPAFRQRFPGIEVRVHTGDEAIAVQRIEQGREDIAIAARPDRLPERLDFLELAITPLVFIAAANTSAEMGEGDESVWARREFILPEAGLVRERADAWFADRTITPKLYAQVTGNEAVVSMVALGLGIGIVPLLVLRGSPFADRVRVLDVHPAPAAFHIGLCARRSALENPLLKALWTLAGERTLRG